MQPMQFLATFGGAYTNPLKKRLPICSKRIFSPFPPKMWYSQKKSIPLKPEKKKQPLTVVPAGTFKTIPNCDFGGEKNLAPNAIPAQLATADSTPRVFMASLTRKA